jgi:biotin operon repressor
LRAADTRQLAQVLEAPSDGEVMLRILQLPETLTTIQSDDPLASARVRGIEARKRLLEAEGGSFSSEEMAEVLHLSRQAVDKRRRANRLIGLDVGRHGYVYPSWQVTDSGTLKGLEEVLTDLKEHDSWMQIQFMLQPNSRLNDRTPLELLRKGDIASVRVAARALGEHGAS